MTVVGTALLDNMGLGHKQELCVQKKGPLIAEKVIVEIVKVSVFISCAFFCIIAKFSFVSFGIVTCNIMVSKQL